MSAAIERRRPIFVRGISRSGGSLVATLLDAHPALAMSYELYPSLLLPTGASAPEVERLAELVRRSGTIRNAVRAIEDRGLSVFLARVPRSGITHGQLSSLLKAHAREGMGFGTVADCLRFVERCAVLKAEAQGKQRWGAKATSRYEDYLSVWPDAYFINVVRDGRDVLASTIRTGSFNKTPESLGRSWSHTHLKFRGLVRDGLLLGTEVRYESLVSDPGAEVSRICEFLGLQYDPGMIRFSEQSLTIYQSEHLSMERLRRPIDATRVGRWRKELTSEQLEAFYSSARDAMVELGYLEPA